MTRIATLGFALLLTGCIQSGIVAATPRSVTVIHPMSDEQSGASQAEAHCTTYGLHARQTDRQGLPEFKVRATFACVP